MDTYRQKIKTSIISSAIFNKRERRDDMRVSRMISVLVLVASLVGWASVKLAFADGDQVLLSAVPKAAKEAAVAAVKGITLTEVEVEKENGQAVYEFKGNTKASLFRWAKEYSIKVTADGKIIKVMEKEKEEGESND
jgi:hypothetical protein